MAQRKCPRCETGNITTEQLRDHWFYKVVCDVCGWWDIEYKYEDYRSY